MKERRSIVGLTRKRFGTGSDCGILTSRGVALASYKNREAVVRETTAETGEKIQECRQQTVPEQTRRKLLAWAKKTATNCDPTLRWLFERYKICPIDVLNIVGSWKAYMVRYRSVIDASVHARSEKARQQQADVLTDAANVLKIWKPLLPFLDISASKRCRVASHGKVVWSLDPEELKGITKAVRCPDPADLEAIAKALRELGPSQAHTIGKLEIKLCARDLTEFFRWKASRPLPLHVGAIIQAAFPDDWNPKGDLKEAAKKLVKERNPMTKGRQPQNAARESRKLGLRYPRLTLAHLALCATAIFLLAAALIVRFFPDSAPFDGDPSSRLRSSRFRVSSISLIDAARLSLNLRTKAQAAG